MVPLSQPLLSVICKGLVALLSLCYKLVVPCSSFSSKRSCFLSSGVLGMGSRGMGILLRLCRRSGVTGRWTSTSASNSISETPFRLLQADTDFMHYNCTEWYSAIKSYIMKHGKSVNQDMLVILFIWLNEIYWYIN